MMFDASNQSKRKLGQTGVIIAQEPLLGDGSLSAAYRERLERQWFERSKRLDPMSQY